MVCEARPLSTISCIRISALPPHLSIVRATFYKGAASSKFPESIKLSATVTAWCNGDIHDRVSNPEHWRAA